MTPLLRALEQFVWEVTLEQSGRRKNERQVELVREKATTSIVDEQLVLNVTFEAQKRWQADTVNVYMNGELFRQTSPEGGLNILPGDSLDYQFTVTTAVF